MIIENLSEEQDLLTLLYEEIEKSEKIFFCVSFLCYSGFSLLVNELNKAMEQEITVQILTSTYDYVTQPAALRSILAFPKIELRIYDGPTAFHIKGYIFKYRDDAKIGSVIIGSANLSKSGLKAGYEWSLFDDNPQIYSDADRIFHQYWELPDTQPVTEEFLLNYEQRYKKFHRKRLEAQGLWKEGVATTSTDAGLPVTPNDVQEQALLQLNLLRSKGINKAAIIAAAGLGKTFLSAFDVQQMGSKSLLFIAHRTELLNQAKNTYKRVLPEVKSIVISEGRNFTGAPFCFATVQSLTSISQRMRQISPNFFDYLVIDEFHHAVADTYQEVLAYFQPRFLLGLTATPERPDGKSVLEICDNNIAYRIDFHEAINKRYLVPFHYFGVADDSAVVYDDIPWRNRQFDPQILEDRVIQRRVDFVIEKVNEYGFDGLKRRVAGFCAGVRHAHYMAEEFQKRGLEAIVLTGEDEVSMREVMYRRLADPFDPLEFIFVADVLNEGIDIPSLNLILFLRPTTSIIVFLQQLGRGLRLHPEKEVLTVIDFVANHKVAWNPLNALQDPSKKHIERRPGDVIPPEGCKIILEDKTREILEKLARRPLTERENVAKQLTQIRRDVNHTLQPADLLPFPKIRPFWEVCRLFGSFIQAKHEINDAQEWEIALENACPEFLYRFERNWQLQREGAYAKIWGLIEGATPDQAIVKFLKTFPEWNCERKTFASANIEKKLETKLDVWYENGDFTAAANRFLYDPQFGADLRQAIKDRIYYYLKYDFRSRYQGILRYPEDLLLGHLYSRPEIINHFQSQYDPAKHNSGVLKFFNGAHIILLVNLKKGVDRERRHQYYYDKPLSRFIFQWQSQNRDSPDKPGGQLYIQHKDRGIAIHLFTQSSSGEPYIYLGQVKYKTHQGGNPMDVTWILDHPLTDEILDQMYPFRSQSDAPEFDWSLL